MPKEIERKFLVRKDLWYALPKPEGELIRQGYLLSGPDLVIRIRIRGNTATLTLKGSTHKATRDEYEYAIPLDQALEIFDLYTRNRIDKMRYTFEFRGNIWEVDEFFGENEGLIIAEIELRDENDTFAHPSWLGEEVTGDARYYNSSLAENPYLHWK